MNKLIRYLGFLPGAFFMLLLVFMAMIGGIDYLTKIPAIMYINICCLFIAAYFLGNKNHHLIGYIAMSVSFISYIYQGLVIDHTKMVFYIFIAIGLIVYFIGYAYLIKRLSNDDF